MQTCGLKQGVKRVITAMQKCTHDGLVQGVALCFWELFTLALCRLCAALREFHLQEGNNTSWRQVNKLWRPPPAHMVREGKRGDSRASGQ